MKNLKITLAQINPTVGALEKNIALHRAVMQQTPEADLIVFPELSVTGYAPEDLLTKSFFIDDVKNTLDGLAKTTANAPALLIGAPHSENGKLYNCTYLLADGKIHSIIKKHYLPNYGVFDEQRWFTSGPVPQPIEFKNTKLGILVCEDFWNTDSSVNFKNNQADGIIVINASPFDVRKHKTRLALAHHTAKDTGLPLAYCNCFGGQDDLVFDGGSFVMNAQGELIQQAVFNAGGALTVNWQASPIPHPEISDHQIYTALVLATRDYAEKNNFKKLLLGLSGGIDSAFVACVAADALGAENVTAAMLATEFTSQISTEDAQTIAKNLRIHLHDIDIQSSVNSLSQLMENKLPNTAPSIVFENLQSRLRGTILMALSNASGALLLTTGNKSEMAMGYATLYGDMNGGFNPVKDLYKTDLYRIAQSCCADRIPERVFTRPPSAELKADQTDQDTLPAYDVLDGILHCLIEENLSKQQTVTRGFDRDLVHRVERSLNLAEYKRRQSAPGPKISIRAFTRERRMPITNGFLDDSAA